MISIGNLIGAFLRHESGAAAVEYALLLGLVSGVAMLSFGDLGSSLSSLFGSMEAGFAQDGTGGAGAGEDGAGGDGGGGAGGDGGAGAGGGGDAGAGGGGAGDDDD